jgi:hypothetical protein
VTTVKAGESWVILTIEKHKVSLLLILEPASQLFLSLPDPGPPRKLLFRAYQASPLRALFHSAFSLLLGRFPFLSFLFNCPRNPYSSARARSPI